MAVWREVSAAIAEDITEGVLAPGARLPPDEHLGHRFSVNRHTVRRALAHLEAQGLVRAERGRGTFVAEHPIPFHLGPRSYFEENLAAIDAAARRTILSTLALGAAPDVAAALTIAPGDPVLLVAQLADASGIPVHVVELFFPLGRVPGLDKVIRHLQAAEDESLAPSAILRSLGVADLRRRDIRISCRAPSEREARLLKIPVREPVLQTRIVNVGPSGEALMYAVTCFAGTRIELTLTLAG